MCRWSQTPTKTELSQCDFPLSLLWIINNSWEDKKLTSRGKDSSCLILYIIIIYEPETHQIGSHLQIFCHSTLVLLCCSFFLRVFSCIQQVGDTKGPKRSQCVRKVQNNSRPNITAFSFSKDRCCGWERILTVKNIRQKLFAPWCL